MITVKEANDKKTYKDFFDLPYILYKKGHPYNVPPLRKEEEDEFNPKINGAFKHSIAKMFVAYDGTKPVGRVGGIINYKYNEKTNEKQVRFTRYDVIDNVEVKNLSKRFHSSEKVKA